MSEDDYITVMIAFFAVIGFVTMFSLIISAVTFAVFPEACSS